MREREQSVGLEPDDAAAKWLEENTPKEALPPSKSAKKSKTLHRWRQAQQKRKA